MSDERAPGGAAPGSDASAGGSGGAGEWLGGEPAEGAFDAGGGGGGVGRIRINSTATPSLEGLCSPALSTAAGTIGPLPLRGQ